MLPTSVFFDVPHIYYLPHFLPIFESLKKRGIEVCFILYSGFDGEKMLEVARKVVTDEDLPIKWVTDIEEGLKFYNARQPSWIIFGNSYSRLSELPADSKTAMVNHGAGIKSAGHKINRCLFDIRFAEGPYQLEQLKKSYPQGNYIDVGFSKLDPLFSSESSAPSLDLQAIGLDYDKPTLLYAPTFYPSSIELFADDWPQTFHDYNLLVKPHFFTLIKKRYELQRRKLSVWDQSDNVYIAKLDEYNLLPFFSVADVLISDASTALFEFAAINKPIVWCDFLKLRWTYRGLLSFRHRKRMDQSIMKYADIAVHAKSYKDLLALIKQQINNPMEREPQRKRYSEKLLGRLDGMVSTRIVDSLWNYQH